MRKYTDEERVNFISHIQTMSIKYNFETKRYDISIMLVDDYGREFKTYYSRDIRVALNRLMNFVAYDVDWGEYPKSRTVSWENTYYK